MMILAIIVWVVSIAWLSIVTKAQAHINAKNEAILLGILGGTFLPWFFYFSMFLAAGKGVVAVLKTGV